MYRQTPTGPVSRLAGSLVAVSLGGCAFSNEGVVDMRRTAQVPVLSAASSKTTSAKPGAPSVPVASALPLAHKNFSLGEKSRLTEGDSLAVTLRTAFIKDFFEIGINPLRGFESNGEIAIVANAFEVETGRELDFADQQAGRLVFFSDDVAAGQFLNFNNLPVYGPKTYGGQPFALQITIFELDSGSEQAKTLLESLAQAGKIAYAPASPVLDLLNGVGKSLLDGAQNDTEFRYTMQFNARPGKPSLNSFVLEAGNYVFVRREERTTSVDWEGLELDENRGELNWRAGTRRADGSQRAQPEGYKENTYLVVEVNSGGSARGIDLKQNTFKDLLDRIATADKAAAGTLKPAMEGIGAALVGRSQLTGLDRTKAALATLERPDASEVARKEAAEGIFTALKASMDGAGAAKVVSIAQVLAGAQQSPPLDSRQVDYVIARLRRIAGAPRFDNLGRAAIAAIPDPVAFRAKLGL